MPRHKSFSTKKRKNVDPVTFDVNEEDFTAVPTRPGAVVLDFIADADSNDGGRAAAALVSFIVDSLVDEDKERFSALIRDPKVNVEIEDLAAICEFLISEYASRPTEKSEPSSTGTSPKRAGRTARTSSEE